MTNIVEEITKARGSKYGPFLHNAIVAQNLKEVMRALPDPDNNRRWEDLPLDVREALDLIALKISRIVTGDPEYLDNWDDIGGYSKIVADRIRANKEAEFKPTTTPLMELAKKQGAGIPDVLQALRYGMYGTQDGNG